MTKPEQDPKAPSAPPSSGSQSRSPQSTEALFADLEEELAEEALGSGDVFNRDTAVPPSSGAPASEQRSQPLTARPQHAGDIFLRATTRPERDEGCGSDAPTRPPGSEEAKVDGPRLPPFPDAPQPALWAAVSTPPSAASFSQSARLLRYVDAQPDQAVSTPPTAGVHSGAPPAAEQLTIEEMRRRYALGDFSGALEAANAILRERPDAEARTTANNCGDILTQMYSAKIGALNRVLRRVMGDEEVTWLTLDHRAGFMLSLVDGQSTVEELLDISGMSRLSALKILSELCEKRVLVGD